MPEQDSEDDDWAMDVIRPRRRCSQLSSFSSQVIKLNDISQDEGKLFSELLMYGCDRELSGDIRSDNQDLEKPDKDIIQRSGVFYRK